ncbi:MAG: PAS domain-containing protein [Candidatus Acetothermia bacterium]
MFVNRAYWDFYGLAEDEGVGKKVEDIIGHEKFNKVIKPRIDRCMEGEVVEFDLNEKHSEQGGRTFSMSFHPLGDFQGNYGTVSVMRDITEQRIAERTLHEERNKLKHLHNAVGVAEEVLDFDIPVIDMVEGDYLVTKSVSFKLNFDELDKFRVGEGIAGNTVLKGETIWETTSGTTRTPSPPATTTGGVSAYRSETSGCFRSSPPRKIASTKTRGACRNPHQPHSGEVGPG